MRKTLGSEASAEMCQVRKWENPAQTSISQRGPGQGEVRNQPGCARILEALQAGLG